MPEPVLHHAACSHARLVVKSAANFECLSPPLVVELPAGVFLDIAATTMGNSSSTAWLLPTQ